MTSIVYPHETTVRQWLFCTGEVAYSLKTNRYCQNKDAILVQCFGTNSAPFITGTGFYLKAFEPLTVQEIIIFINISIFTYPHESTVRQYDFVQMKQTTLRKNDRYCENNKVEDAQWVWANGARVSAGTGIYLMAFGPQTVQEITFFLYISPFVYPHEIYCAPMRILYRWSRLFSEKRPLLR
jgi:hypothetical protein